MATESWRPLEGYGTVLASRYEVSSLGRIRTRRHRVRKTWFTSRGYETVRLTACPAGVARNVSVHVAVLSTFIGPRPAGAVTRHLDGNPANNHVSNLAWGSQSENLRDRRRHGTDPNAGKTHCAAGHPYDSANTYEYTTRQGWNRRGCRKCNRAAVDRYQGRLRARRGAA